jgi:hypothetical protein
MQTFSELFFPNFIPPIVYVHGESNESFCTFVHSV